jgi:hypothetical protein
MARVSQLVFLDEAKTEAKRHGHPILSVGGVSVDQADLCAVEDRWRAEKESRGLVGFDLRYAMSWPEKSAQRLEMIEVIPSLPLKQGVVALLEDFRPPDLQQDKEKRKDLYVHGGCFDFVLQRLRARQYEPGLGGGHIVVFDHGDHFRELDRKYRDQHDLRRLPWGDEWPSLREKGYSESLVAAAGGPLNEIADLVVGAVTRWAACRCGEAQGMDIAESAELTQACRAVLPLFPTTESIPSRWTGWSFVVFKEPRTQGRQLNISLDGWLRGLSGDDA